MSASYPTSFVEIAAWARENRRPVAEARARFAQYIVLWAIAQSTQMRTSIVFKGGNALDFIWSTNRSTKDLDFSADMTLFHATSVDEIRTLLTQALAPAESSFNTAFRVQRVEQQPPGAGRTFITYQCTIGYALEDDQPNRIRIQRHEGVANIVPIDISLNEPIKGVADVSLIGTRALRVSTVEDIVSEKLRAMLQQPSRNRSRPQDLLDIAVIVENHHSLDVGLVASYLIEKSAARNITVSRAAFHHPEVAIRSKVGYAELALTTRERFIDFETALGIFYILIDRLNIPD